VRHLIALFLSPFVRAWKFVADWFYAMNYPSERGIAQRAAYQRGFVPGWIFVIAVVLLFVWWVKSLDSPTNASIEPYTVKEVRINPETKPSDTVMAAKTSATKWKPYPQHEGFAGFDGYNVISDVTIEFTPPPIEAPEVYSKLDIGDDSDIFSFSPIEGDDTGIYVPEEYVYDMEDGVLEEEPVNIALDVIYHEDPEYPLIAKDEGEQGKVSLLIFVDETGNVSVFPEETTAKNYTIQTKKYTVDGRKGEFDYVVAFEDSPGWFFVEKLLEVLPRWKFRPEIVDGQVASNFLVVTYNYCLGLDCLKLEIQRSSMP